MEALVCDDKKETMHKEQKQQGDILQSSIPLLLLQIKSVLKSSNLPIKLTFVICFLYIL